MKLTISEIAQFAVDAKIVRDYVAETTINHVHKANLAAERIRKLARRMMGAEATVKVN